MNAETVIKISRHGSVIATCSPEEVMRGLASGKIVATDHYWMPGMTEWVTVAELKVQLDKQSRDKADQQGREARRKAEVSRLEARRLADQALAARQRKAEAAAIRASMVPRVPLASGKSDSLDENLHLIGVAGGACVVLSTITPFVSIGTFFRVTLMSAPENAKAWIFIALGASGVALSIKRHFDHLRIVAGLTLALACEIVFRLMSMRGDIGSGRRGRGGVYDIGDVVMASVSAEIGALLLFVGICCLFYAAFKPRN